MIIEKINAYLSGPGAEIPPLITCEVSETAMLAFARQFGQRQERKNTLRLSSIGKCLRQQAYNVLGFEANGKEIDSRSRMVFFQGDMVELAVIQLAKLAGCPVEDCQTEVGIHDVTGHPDGVLGDHLVEVKSMSSYGFAEFQRGILDEGYRYQCNAYMYALGLKKTCLVALNKDSGVLHEMIFSIDAQIVKDIKDRILRLKYVAEDTLPSRPYEPDAKGFLPWQCLYCAHWKTCRPNAEKVLVNQRYKLKEKPLEATHA